MVREALGLGLGVYLTLCSAPAQACDSGSPELLGQLAGEWHSNGTAFGQPAQSHMHWQQILDGCFFRLTYTIKLQPGSEKEQLFRGEGTYRVGDAAIEGFWADNSGDLHPLKAQIDAEVFTVHWGSAGSKQGRSRYALDEAGKVTVSDWLLGDAGWKQFNHNLFDRDEPKP